MRLIDRIRRRLEPAPEPGLAQDIFESYEGLMAVDVTASEGAAIAWITNHTWPGMIEALRAASAPLGLQAAGLTLHVEIRRVNGKPSLVHEYRLNCVGTQVPVAPALRPVLEALGSPTVSAVWTEPGSPLASNPTIAVSIVDAGEESRPYPHLGPIADRFLTPLSRSGMRSMPPALVWAGLLDHDLGRIGLAVRRGRTDRYIVLVESRAVRPELYRDIGAAMVHDGRVDQLTIRPVADDDPILFDTRYVFPIRRYPDVPRSGAIFTGELVPGGSVSLSPDERSKVSKVIFEAGLRRAGLAVVEQRSVVGWEPRVVMRDPVQVAVAERLLLESRRDALIVADDRGPDEAPWLGSLDAEERLQALLDESIGADRLAIVLTHEQDPVFAAADPVALGR